MSDDTPKAALAEDLKRIEGDTPAHSAWLEAGASLASTHAFESWAELGVKPSDHTALSGRVILDDAGAITGGVRFNWSW